MSTDVSIASAADDLETHLGSDRVLQSGTSYEEARRLWNRAVDVRPALIARRDCAMYKPPSGSPETTAPLSVRRP